MAAVGIDLGTTYTRFSFFHNDNVEIITNNMGNRKTPTYVAFTEEGCLFGDEAKNQSLINPRNTIFNFLRFIGKKFSDPIIQKDIINLPFKIISGDNDQPLFAVENQNEVKRISVDELVTMFLSFVKEIIEKQMNDKIGKVVITIPSYFNTKQRFCIKKAAEKAGFTFVSLVNTSLLSMINFKIIEKKDNEYYAMSFDFGGGTLDVSLVYIVDGIIETISTSGNNHLGGEDINNNMIEYFAERFKEKYKSDLRQSPRALLKLRKACENAKKTLSTYSSAKIVCDSIYEGHDLVDNISLQTFEYLNDELLDSIMIPVKRAIKDANVSKDDILHVILFGGSSKVHFIEQLFREFFNGKKIYKGINPDESAVFGAAFQSGIISFDTNMSNILNDLLIIQAIPISLGVETKDEKQSLIIFRNRELPAKLSSVFTTTRNNQKEISIKIFEGDFCQSTKNDLIGVLNFSEVSQAPKGVPRIEIIFDIDSLGCMKVTARDKSTDISKTISIDVDNIAAPIQNADIEEYNPKKGLENLCFTTRDLLFDDKILKNVSQENKDLIKLEINDTIDWMMSNRFEDDSVYEEKQIKLEKFIKEKNINEYK